MRLDFAYITLFGMVLVVLYHVSSQVADIRAEQIVQTDSIGALVRAQTILVRRSQ